MQYQRTIIVFAVPFLIILGGVWYFIQNEKPEPQTQSLPLTPGIMKLSSPAFEHNQNIPPKYTCDGENISPPLHISQVPAEAKSLVLIVDDPDAPAKTWVHWVVFNIDPGATEVTEGAAPAGIEGTTDFGKPGYGGPCPPSGTHRYFHKIYALDTQLDLTASATKTDVEAAMEGHILDKAELVGLYERQR